MTYILQSTFGVIFGIHKVFHYFVNTFSNTHDIVMTVINLCLPLQIKCEVYWPENESETVECGRVVITCSNIADMGEYVVRHFLVERVSQPRVEWRMLPGGCYPVGRHCYSLI